MNHIPKHQTRLLRILLVIAIVSVFLAILVFSKTAIFEMTIESFKSVVDYIINAISSLK